MNVRVITEHNANEIAKLLGFSPIGVKTALSHAESERAYAVVDIDTVKRKAKNKTFDHYLGLRSVQETAMLYEGKPYLQPITILKKIAGMDFVLTGNENVPEGEIMIGENK